MRFITGSSPLKNSLSEPIKVLLIGALLITPIATAQAAEDAPTNRDSEKLIRQILSSLDDSDFTPKSPSGSSQKPTGNGFQFSKKGQIQYWQTLQIGDDEISITLYGPVVRKSPGLRFRVEGFRVGDHPVHLEGFGYVNAGGFRVTVRF
jgi:hypothetical protein